MIRYLSSNLLFVIISEDSEGSWVRTALGLLVCIYDLRRFLDERFDFPLH